MFWIARSWITNESLNSPAKPFASLNPPISFATTVFDRPLSPSDAGFMKPYPTKMAKMTRIAMMMYLYFEKKLLMIVIVYFSQYVCNVTLNVEMPVRSSGEEKDRFVTSTSRRLFSSSWRKSMNLSYVVVTEKDMLMDPNF